jgi:lipopolysaccharide transport system ATP-binding protein
MKPIISVRGLGKQYRLGTKVAYKTLRESLMSAIAASARLFRKSNGRETIWALKDISFDINEGDVVGIIGRNGAGKSTLLKILSSITEPTEGEVRLRGRVGSLLEVGTGFHPELTGRENIFLNGTILGMSRAEIKKKFDEIVDFAEIEKFLDTPVKRYSSGMYVRLAFAVAAHLEPEILLVDEVLAVGDAQFQKKCLGKMKEVGKKGRTILFVSHNMGAVNTLCSEAILLQKGELLAFSDASHIVSKYLEVGAETTGYKTWPKGIGNDAIKLIKVRLLNSKNVITNTFDITESIYIEKEFVVLKAIEGARVGFRLTTSDGIIVFTSEDTDDCESLNSKTPGLYRTITHIPGNFLNEGQYFLTFGSHFPMVQINYFEENCLSLTIQNTGGVGGFVDDKRRGIIRPRLEWKYEYIKQRNADGE